MIWKEYEGKRKRWKENNARGKMKELDRQKEMYGEERIMEKMSKEKKNNGKMIMKGRWRYLKIMEEG